MGHLTGSVLGLTLGVMDGVKPEVTVLVGERVTASVVTARVSTAKQRNGTRSAVGEPFSRRSGTTTTKKMGGRWEHARDRVLENAHR